MKSRTWTSAEMTRGDTMRIQYLLAANYARGGIRVQIEHANHLHRRGHRVEIISPHEPPDWIDVETEWKQIEIPAGQALGSSLPPADITVFSYYEQAFSIYRNLEHLESLPVYLAQGDELLFASIEEAATEDKRKSIEAAHASLSIPYPILTVSSPTKEYIESKGGRDVSVIPNGIDPDRFKPLPEKNNDPLRVLSVGAEIPEFKGIKDIYAVLMRMEKDPEVPPFQFVRASPAPNAFARLPIDVEYHEKPSQEKLAGLYAGADLFIGASTMESFYLLPLEAMASGTAVVCSNLPALRDYARPERDYLPFAPGDVGGLYQAAKFALQSASTRRLLRENGLKLAAKMAWPEIIERLEDYFFDTFKEKDRWLKKLLRHKQSGKLVFTFEKRPRSK